MNLPTEQGDELNALALRLHNNCITDAIYDDTRFIEITLEYNKSHTQAIMWVECAGNISKHFFTLEHYGWHNLANRVEVNDLPGHTRYGKSSVYQNKWVNNLARSFELSTKIPTRLK